MQKNLKLLIIILSILSGVLALKSFLPQFLPTTSPYTEKIKDIKKENVTSLSVSKLSESVKLEKVGDTWKADGKKADKNKIDDLLNGLLSDDLPELISQTDSRHKELELTGDFATQVKINDGLTVFLGKSAKGAGIYVRFETDNNVYLVKNLYSSSLSPSLSYWADKTILAIDQVKLRKLEFTQNKKNFILVNKDNKWVEEKTGREPNKDKLDPVLTSLSSLTAESLVSTESSKVYPSTAQIVMTVEYDGGNETLNFYQGKNDYKVVRDSDKEEFIVTNSTAEKFLSYLFAPLIK